MEEKDYFRRTNRLKERIQIIRLIDFGFLAAGDNEIPRLRIILVPEDFMIGVLIE
jgi:hypothetical protein